MSFDKVYCAIENIIINNYNADPEGNSDNYYECSTITNAKKHKFEVFNKDDQLIVTITIEKP